MALEIELKYLNADHDHARIVMQEQGGRKYRAIMSAMWFLMIREGLCSKGRRFCGFGKRIKSP